MLNVNFYDEQQWEIGGTFESAPIPSGSGEYERKKQAFYSPIRVQTFTRI